jgi:type VI secretion system protein ImpK
MTELAHTAANGLPELCSDLFSLALQLRKGAFPDEAETLRREIGGLFSRLDRAAKEQEIGGDSVTAAQYAIAAFLDEIILGTDWPGREQWSRRPLQLQYFDDVTAGERFYNKLDALRGTREPDKLDVLEVYATCLGLGFKGKFSELEDREKPRLLVVELLRELKAARKQPGDDLSTHWKPEDYVLKATRKVPAWLVLSICAGVLLAMFLVLDLGLSAEMRALPDYAPVPAELPKN